MESQRRPAFRSAAALSQHRQSASVSVRQQPWARVQVLIAPRGHPALEQEAVDREELYRLEFVSLNGGSSVQTAQAAMLRRQGIAWPRLKINMVRGAPRYRRTVRREICSCA